MQFNQDFWEDVEEAFEYWQSHQNPETQEQVAAVASMTPTTWAARILATSVYALIAEKRALFNSTPQEAPDVQEEGRQGETDAH